ncbi:MAG: hypothetical protein AAF901_02450 [Bacteroidota bacterium]
MKIVTEPTGPIYWSTSFPGAGDCGQLGKGASKQINYPEGKGSVGIRLLKDENAHVMPDDESYQRVNVDSNDLVEVKILVNGVVQ